MRVVPIIFAIASAGIVHVGAVVPPKCNANNCYRAVARASAQGLVDCSAFPAYTATVTNTILTTSISTTVGTPSIARTGINYQKRSAAPSPATIPAYASACQGSTLSYASVCSCLSAPASTVTIMASITVTATTTTLTSTPTATLCAQAIQNPSYEAATGDPWVFAATGNSETTLAFDTLAKDVHKGVKSLQISEVNGKALGFTQTQNVKICIGQTYTLSAWLINGNTDSPCHLNMCIDNDCYPFDVPGDYVYRQYSVVASAPAAATAAVVKLTDAGSAQNCFGFAVDDWSLLPN